MHFNQRASHTRKGHVDVLDQVIFCCMQTGKVRIIKQKKMGAFTCYKLVIYFKP